MKKIINFFLIFFLIPGILFSESEIQIEKYKLKQGKLKFRYGSGLAFAKASTYGSISFYLFSGGDFLITDGKENRDSEEVPHVAMAKLKKDKFKIAKRFPLYFEDSEKKLAVDLEGIATAPDKIVWLADEKSNSILKVSLEDGSLQEIVSPGAGLPEFLSEVTPNRGLEGISVAPNGNVYLTLQSPIKESHEYISLIEYDPKLKKSKEFKIPVNVKDYVSPLEIKIGDIQAIDKNRFIIAEHGSSKKKYLSKIFEIKILKDQEIVEKKLLLDLKDHGWKYDKLEGLTLVDASTIGIMNDWSDGISANHLWLINLPEPLISWGFREWSLFACLFIIFIFSTVLTFIVIFKK